MSGDYPSTDFEIVDDQGLRTVLHRPTGMVLETSRLPSDPIAVSAAYTVNYADAAARPSEIVQAALRHLRVWLMRRYGRGAIRPRPST
jgi:hypothetical protein